MFVDNNPARIVDTRDQHADLPGEHKLAPGEELLVDIIGGIAGFPAGAVTLNVAGFFS